MKTVMIDVGSGDSIELTERESIDGKPRYSFSEFLDHLSAIQGLGGDRKKLEKILIETALVIGSSHDQFLWEGRADYVASEWILKTLVVLLGLGMNQQPSLEDLAVDFDWSKRFPYRESTEKDRDKDFLQQVSKKPDGWDGWVYLIVDEPRQVCKIGFSTNVKSRLESIQTGYPYKLSVAAVNSGNVAIERGFHAKFADNRLNGEWFVLTDEIKKEFGVEVDD